MLEHPSTSGARGLALLLTFLASAPAAAGEPAPLHPLKKLSDHEYQLGSIVIDKARHEIRFPAAVNMNDGLVELLLCTKYGKTHESVFVTRAKPIHIQTALLLLGARAGRMRYEPDADRVPEGDRFAILVRVGDQPARRAEDFVWHDKHGRPMAKTDWTFTGSKIAEGQFAADVDGSIVATFYDPRAILNNPLPTGFDDENYVANSKATPPAGTPVTLIMRKTKADEKRHP